MDINLKFHHIGIGTPRFEAAIGVYETIGYTLVTSVDDPRLGVKVAFLNNRQPNSPWIEVLSPLGANSPLRSLIDRGSLPSPYHTCYAVHDIKTAQGLFKCAGLTRITPDTPAVAFEGALVAFFYSNAVGMIELVENPPRPLI